jgi:hypothetical protein
VPLRAVKRPLTPLAEDDKPEGPASGGDADVELTQGGDGDGDKDDGAEEEREADGAPPRHRRRIARARPVDCLEQIAALKAQLEDVLSGWRRALPMAVSLCACRTPLRGDVFRTAYGS